MAPKLVKLQLRYCRKCIREQRMSTWFKFVFSHQKMLLRILTLVLFLVTLSLAVCIDNKDKQVRVKREVDDNNFINVNINDNENHVRFAREIYHPIRDYIHQPLTHLRNHGHLRRRKHLRLLDIPSPRGWTAQIMSYAFLSQNMLYLKKPIHSGCDVIF